MNKHIELVKKWLADKDSVSLEQLEANKDAADDASYASYDADWKAAAHAAKYAHAHAAKYAKYAEYTATYSAVYYAAADAAYWVKRYEELTK